MTSESFSFQPTVAFVWGSQLQRFYTEKQRKKKTKKSRTKGHTLQFERVKQKKVTGEKKLPSATQIINFTITHKTIKQTNKKTQFLSTPKPNPKPQRVDRWCRLSGPNRAEWEQLLFCPHGWLPSAVVKHRWTKQLLISRERKPGDLKEKKKKKPVSVTNCSSNDVVESHDSWLKPKHTSLTGLSRNKVV